LQQMQPKRFLKEVARKTAVWQNNVQKREKF
jgi:hypothetical protein